MRSACRPLFVAVLLFTATAAWSQNYSISAKLEPTNAVVGDTILYIVSVTYEGREPPHPSAPELDPSWGPSKPQMQGRQTQVQIVNGRASRSIHYTYSFRAEREGAYTIPGARLQVNGQTYRSNPVTLTVRRDTSTPNLPAELQGRVVPPQVPGNNKLQRELSSAVFILPVIENQTPYTGQQVLLSFHLFIDSEALGRAGLATFEGMNQVDVPDLQQFLKEEVYPLPSGVKFKERLIGSRRYHVAPLYQVAITPTKTGELKIEPFRGRLIFSQTDRNGAFSRDPFFGADPLNDPFFDSFSPFRSRRLEVVASSPPMTINVKPLPQEGRPAGFNGAVGDFSMSATADKQNAIAEEDFVTLRVRVEGKGDASGLSNPELPQVEGLTLLEEPKSSTDLRTENDELITAKTFEYILRPTKPGKIEIPPVAMSVFNPEEKRYTSINSGPLAINVQPPTKQQTALVAPTTRRDAAEPEALRAEDAADRDEEHPDDLQYIHVGALNTVRPGPLAGQGPLFFLLLALPPLLLLAAFVAGRRRAAYQTNRDYYREAAAGTEARKRLRKAARLLNSDEGDRFFDELARSIRGFFGDKFHIDPASLTIDEIERELAERQASQESVASARKLLEQCDFARFAPAKPDQAEMKQAYREAAQLIGKAEKL